MQSICHVSNMQANMCWRVLNLLALLAAVGADYIIDDSGGLGRMFDGIGGLSGGGVANTYINIMSRGNSYSYEWDVGFDRVCRSLRYPIATSADVSHTSIS